MLEWFDLLTSKKQNTWTTLSNIHLKPHVVEINGSVSLMRTQVITVTLNSTFVSYICTFTESHNIYCII